MFAIDPEAFGGRTNEAVCAAMEAEGVRPRSQYPSINRDQLFQPSLSRLPVAIEFAGPAGRRSDVLPGGRGPAQRESVYFVENVFRDGDRGIEDAVDALAKIQRHADELTKR